MSVIVPGMNMVHERVCIRPRNVSLSHFPRPQPLNELLRAEFPQGVCVGEPWVSRELGKISLWADAMPGLGSGSSKAVPTSLPPGA